MNHAATCCIGRGNFKLTNNLKLKLSDKNLLEIFLSAAYCSILMT